VDESGLSLDGTRIVARSAIAHAYVFERGTANVVRLARAWSPIDVVVRSRAEGHALLAAAQLDELAPPPVRFRLGAGTTRRSWFVLALAIACIPVAMTSFLAKISIVLPLLLCSSLLLLLSRINSVDVTV